MTGKEEALYFFRKLLYVLYLEIGGLQPKIHPEIAGKADLKNAFFQGEKQRHTAELYRLTETEEDPDKIIAPYIERTHLTLEDLRRAFAEGDWRNKFGGYNQGGPRFVKITDAALKLRDLIEREDWEEAKFLLFDIKAMKTNQGYLINQFEWTERRRR